MVHAVDQNSIVGARQQLVGPPAGMVVHRAAAVGHQQHAVGVERQRQFVFVLMALPPRPRVHEHDMVVFRPAGAHDVMARPMHAKRLAFRLLEVFCAAEGGMDEIAAMRKQLVAFH